MKPRVNKKMSTTEINKNVRLAKPDRLEELYGEYRYYRETGFSEWLADLIDRRECALLKEEYYSRNSLAKMMSFHPSYFNDLASGKSAKRPTRERVIEIGLTLKLTEDQINQGLKYAGHRRLNAHYILDRYVINGIANGMDKDTISECLMKDKKYKGKGFMPENFLNED